jgi:hypothetical protein
VSLALLLSALISLRLDLKPIGLLAAAGERSRGVPSVSWFSFAADLFLALLFWIRGLGEGSGEASMYLETTKRSCVFSRDFSDRICEYVERFLFGVFT